MRVKIARRRFMKIVLLRSNYSSWYVKNNVLYVNDTNNIVKLHFPCAIYSPALILARVDLSHESEHRKKTKCNIPRIKGRPRMDCKEIRRATLYGTLLYHSLNLISVKVAYKVSANNKTDKKIKNQLHH